MQKKCLRPNHLACLEVSVFGAATAPTWPGHISSQRSMPRMCRIYASFRVHLKLWLCRCAGAASIMLHSSTLLFLALEVTAVTTAYDRERQVNLRNQEGVSCGSKPGLRDKHPNKCRRCT